MVNCEKAGAANSGTFLHPETPNFEGNGDATIAHTGSHDVDALEQRCFRCGREQTRLFPFIFRTGRFCLGCILVAARVLKQECEIAPAPKVVAGARKTYRLYHCFGCRRSFALGKMSSCLVVCLGCLVAARREGATRDRFVEKTLLRIGAYLRGRV